MPGERALKLKHACYCQTDVGTQSNAIFITCPLKWTEEINAENIHSTHSWDISINLIAFADMKNSFTLRKLVLFHCKAYIHTQRENVFMKQVSRTEYTVSENLLKTWVGFSLSMCAVRKNPSMAHAMMMVASKLFTKTWIFFPTLRNICLNSFLEQSGVCIII